MVLFLTKQNTQHIGCVNSEAKVRNTIVHISNQNGPDINRGGHPRVAASKSWAIDREKHRDYAVNLE